MTDTGLRSAIAFTSSATNKPFTVWNRLGKRDEYTSILFFMGKFLVERRIKREGKEEANQLDPVLAIRLQTVSYLSTMVWMLN